VNRALERSIVISALLLSLSPGIALGQPFGAPPPRLTGQMPDVEVEPKLGARVPLDLAFRDERGRPIRLGEYFGERPVILALAYYECPMLCTLVLNGLVRGLKPLSLEPGRDFEVVVVSIDHEETSKLAAAKKRTYLSQYGNTRTADGWHFLTGEKDAIAVLAKSVGFGYVYQPEIDQWAHGAGVTILTPNGVVSRYLYGVEYAPRDLKLSLVEASDEVIATAVDRLLLLCFHYDPIAGKYGLAIMSGLRAGAVLTVLGLIGFVVLMLRRERKRPPELGRAEQWS
jgi:protein SCO1